MCDKQVKQELVGYTFYSQKNEGIVKYSENIALNPVTYLELEPTINFMNDVTNPKYWFHKMNSNYSIGDQLDFT